MKFHLVKIRTGYIPASADDYEASAKIETGELVEVTSSDQRCIKFHRMFFALIKLAYDNLPENLDGHFPTIDDFRYEITRRSGFYREYTDFKGNVNYRPESINFSNMGQERFEKLYEKVLNTICKELFWEKSDILEQLKEF